MTTPQPPVGDAHAPDRTHPTVSAQTTATAGGAVRAARAGRADRATRVGRPALGATLATGLALVLAACGGAPGPTPDAVATADAAVVEDDGTGHGVWYGGGDEGVVPPDLDGVRAPATATADGGIPVSAAGVGVEGDADVVVDVYLDPACPWCRTFEVQHGPDLWDLVAEGGVTVVHRPVAFLDARWGGTYSTRAVNAIAHVADAAPEQHVAFLEALLHEQPEAGEPEGLDDGTIAAIATGVGVPDDVVAAFTSASTTAYRVTTPDGTEDRAAPARTFAPWAAAALERAGQDQGQVSVPLVLVDGVRVGDWSEPGSIADLVRAALAARSGSGE